MEHFAPTFTLKKRTDQMFGNYQQVDDAAFYLGMVELISYWKITCSPLVIIACHALDDYQIAWFKKLYQRKEELSQNKYIIPNLEFRMTPETKDGKGINLHLIINSIRYF